MDFHFPEKQRPVQDAQNLADYKILVVDDHAIVRAGLSNLFRVLLGDRARIIEAASAREAVLALQANPDVALTLLDLTLPDTCGLTGLHTLRHSFPDLRFVIFSAEEDFELMLEAYRLGISGYIPKNSDLTILISALRLLIAGGQYMPAAVMSALTKQTGQELRVPAPPSLPLHADKTPLAINGWQQQLSARQMAVLRLMIAGKPNKEIASKLGLAVGTVKNHVAAILLALGASNRAQAATTALMAGILPDTAE